MTNRCHLDKSTILVWSLRSGIGGYNECSVLITCLLVDKPVTAPVSQYAAVYGNEGVITDGEWLDIYNLGSDIEKSHVYISSALLEEMWFQIDFGRDRLVCAVNIYSRSREFKHYIFLNADYYLPDEQQHLCILILSSEKFKIWLLA